MDKIKKLLCRVPKKDRKRINHMMTRIFQRDLTGVDCKRLKKHKYIYRVRTGDYRIIYYDNGEKIVIKAIRRRNKTTYKEM